ncbi:MAG: hypothetical protein OEZ36_07660, partial [Spirochaetota bacterium]|nr:hypothetical protein [Spirochaetota bacterium]
MKERKVSAFQFKRISRDETGKPPQKPVESPSPAEKNAGDNSIITSDRDLLRSIGDKDSLQTTE